MQDESDLVPYRAVALRGERVLVIAPHPDDELLGCGGLLAQHARECRTVRVVIVTDGGGFEGPGATRDEVRAVRRDEAGRGLQLLGISDVRFLDFEDRTLSAQLGRLVQRIEKELAAFGPDLVLAPSPVEIHPDHRAVGEALYRALSSSASLTASIPSARVAFFEVSQPLRPNVLVDITHESALKQQALAEHRSQLSRADYAGAIQGLNAYRALTLGGDAKFAEAYWTASVETFRSRSWEELRREAGGTAAVQEARSLPEITVVIRTRNRPALLREALDSVRANDLHARIVVVNDGGTSVADVVRHRDVEVVEHPDHRGPGAAMNSGVSAARSTHVAFLDDDDLYLPEHLSTLAHAAAGGAHTGWYTDAVSVVYELDPAGRYVESQRARVYEHDFDGDLLRLTNYVPVPTLLVRRDDYLAAGGFAEDLPLFEDWDFLLRLTRRGPLLRVPRLTVSIRHLPDSGSIILSSPQGTAAYEAARLQVWERNDVFRDAAAIGRGIDSLRGDVLGEARAAAGRLRELADARQRLAMFVRTSRESRLALEEARMLVRSELALHPKRRARVDAILDAAFAANRTRLESIARYEDDPGGPLEPVAARSAGQETESLRRELQEARKSLEDIHRSTLWKVGSMYWRLLHALGVLKIRSESTPPALKDTPSDR